MVIMHVELEGIGNDMVMPYPKVVSWHSPKRTQDNHDSWCCGKGLKQVIPEYKSDILPLGKAVW